MKALPSCQEEVQSAPSISVAPDGQNCLAYWQLLSERKEWADFWTQTFLTHYSQRTVMGHVLHAHIHVHMQIACLRMLKMRKSCFCKWLMINYLCHFYFLITNANPRWMSMTYRSCNRTLSISWGGHTLKKDLTYDTGWTWMTCCVWQYQILANIHRTSKRNSMRPQHTFCRCVWVQASVCVCVYRNRYREWQKASVTSSISAVTSRLLPLLINHNPCQWKREFPESH